MSAAVSAPICLVRAPAFCTFVFYTVTASIGPAIMTSGNYTLLYSGGTSDRTTVLFIARRAVSGVDVESLTAYKSPALHHQIRRKRIHHRSFRQCIYLGARRPDGILPEPLHLRPHHLDGRDRKRHGDHQMPDRLHPRPLRHLGQEHCRPGPHRQTGARALHRNRLMQSKSTEPSRPVLSCFIFIRLFRGPSPIGPQTAGPQPSVFFISQSFSRL